MNQSLGFAGQLGRRTRQGDVFESGMADVPSDLKWLSGVGGFILPQLGDGTG